MPHLYSYQSLFFAHNNVSFQTACVYRVRFIQEQHIGIQNYGDIGYNFLIGDDGNVYEGRGWLSVGAFLIGIPLHDNLSKSYCQYFIFIH